MDRRIRVLALFLVVCFGLLFLQLNYLQISHASQLLANPNAKAEDQPASPFSQPRGEIITADGVVIAQTVPSKDSVGQQREYPDPALFADVTGYYDAVDQTETGVEGAYNTQLLQHASPSGTLHQIITEHTGTDNVVLTVRDDLQKVARAALGGKLGAIIAIDPQTGAILAMYGNPSFDPNEFASHESSVVKAAYKKDYTDYANQQNAPGSPLTNQVTEHTFAPGSTMKVITTAAIYDHDPPLASKVWPYASSIPLPLTSLTLHNFGGETCGGDLARILTVSCDTAYAEVGLALGAPSLVDEAHAFGFNQVPPIDVDNVLGGPGATAAVIPAPSQLPGADLAYSAIGQYNDQQTVLGNALVAAGIGDGGTIMTPHVMAHIVDNTGAIVSSYAPHAWLHATSSATADQVRSLMLNVTGPGGTAAGLFPPTDNVAAKTGTAETSGTCTANWLIATAPAGPNDNPRVAVAAVIPAQPGVACGSESVTGATIAGPAVATLLTAALAVTK